MPTPTYLQKPVLQTGAAVLAHAAVFGGAFIAPPAIILFGVPLIVAVLISEAE